MAPPSNLTTADILDLPIIFADNDSTLLQATNIEEAPVFMTQKKQPTSKYVVINKQTLVPSTSPQNVLKRPAPPIRTTGQKYARIIINPNQLQETDDGKRHVLITNQQKLKSNDEIVTISPKKIDTCQSLEFVDLETELKTNTVPKPMHTTVVSAQAIKNKPDIKHFASGSRNVAMRIPFSMTRGHSRVVGAEPSTSGDNIFVLNNIVNRKRSGKSNDSKQKPINYKIECSDDVLEDAEVDK